MLQDVYAVLKPGKENAIKAAEIARATGYTVKEISRRVKIERRQGVAICSCQEGYYLAESEKDIKDICGRLYHRAGEIFKTRRALLQHLTPAEITAENTAAKAANK